LTDLIPLRRELREQVKTGRIPQALEQVLALARRDQSPACWRFVHKELEHIDAATEDAAPALRFALASYMTADNIVPYLNVACRLMGVRTSFYICPYNQFHLEMRNPQSGLYQFESQATILITDVASLQVPSPPFDSHEDSEAARNEAIDALKTLAELYRQHTDGSLLINNFIQPTSSPRGIFDDLEGQGVAGFYRRLNAALPETLGKLANVFIVDADQLAAAMGHETALNRRLYYLARMPYAESFSQRLALRYAAHIRAARGLNRKCLVVDLDNVLWGGVIGEDGIHGVKVGTDPPGNVYRAIQQAIKELSERGVILAIASKNNPGDVNQLLDERSDMVLNRDHFTLMEIGWHDKVDSIRRIASQLNIGLDSIVFLDDNPRERLSVESQLPEVLVMPFPDDICELPEQIRTCGYFDTPSITGADRKRGQMYAQRIRRQAAESTANSMHDFLMSLSLELTIRPVEAADLPRAAQLTQRTNQFNLTTRRYLEDDLAKYLQDPAWKMLLASVRDKFGDEGVVGLVMVEQMPELARIDSFLLSCRVLGRGVEQGLLAATVKHCRESGDIPIVGAYIPTAKNEQTREFFPRNGFGHECSNSETIEWQLLPGERGPQMPEWIKCDCELKEG
jgi:FkbH-like protein